MDVPSFAIPTSARPNCVDPSAAINSRDSTRADAIGPHDGSLKICAYGSLGGDDVTQVHVTIDQRRYGNAVFELACVTVEVRIGYGLAARQAGDAFSRYYDKTRGNKVELRPFQIATLDANFVHYGLLTIVYGMVCNAQSSSYLPPRYIVLSSPPLFTGLNRKPFTRLLRPRS